MTNVKIVNWRCTINSKINGTPMCLLYHFEATLYLSRSEFT